MVKSRRPQRLQVEPETAGDLMSGLLTRLGGKGRALEYRVYDAYLKAAGEMLAARTTPDSFREGTLFVRTTSSALAHEIVLLRAELLQRMETMLGPGVVKDIRTRVGGPPEAPSRPV